MYVLDYYISTQVNSFQGILATDGTQSFVIYHFEDINWAAGTTNGGSSSTGLGGTGAQVTLILMDLSWAIMDLNHLYL